MLNFGRKAYIVERCLEVSWEVVEIQEQLLNFPLSERTQVKFNFHIYKKFFQIVTNHEDIVFNRFEQELISFQKRFFLNWQEYSMLALDFLIFLGNVKKQKEKSHKRYGDRNSEF